MRYFPIFLDTIDLTCLVVGAGEVAARKVELLLKTSANITVVAPWACDTVQRPTNGFCGHR
jgi:uroporphyrin-III C-methyltransferase/precorrin-2 dehydrogenase/sirohydrochlorin ferrochelatase